MTAEEINRRVAEALGWKVKQGATGWRWFKGQMPVSDTFPTKGSTERHVPHFATDAAAAALVKAHMRAKGWHYRSGWGTDGGFAYTVVRLPGVHIGESYAQESEEMALCLAFLAACEASKEVE